MPLHSKLQPLKQLHVNKENKSLMYIPTEILQKISSHFTEDISTLFSCILVSRNWCTSLIGILWSQPFHLSHSPRLIEIYLSFLPENTLDQLKLKNFHPRNTKYEFTFDYPSFLRKLSIPLLCNVIGEYLRKELNITTLPSSKINYYTINNIEQIMYTDLLKLFSKQKQIIITPTFKLLVEKQIIILRELCKLIYNKIDVISEFEFNIGINFSEDVTFLDRQLAVEDLMNLQDRFKGLKVLVYSGNNNVLCFLAKHCKRIESLKLFRKNELDNDDPSIQLISAQKNLRNLEIHDWNINSSNIIFPSITPLLESIQTQSNSLRSIKIIDCNFNKSKPLRALSKCHNLEEIIIKENYNFNERLIAPLTKTKFSNLRIFIYQYQLNNFINDEEEYDDNLSEDRFIEDDEFINPNEIFSRIIFNAKDSLRIVSINGFKTLQSLNNTLNSLIECRNLIKLDIMLKKSENVLPLLLSIIEHNQSLEKLYIISDTPDLLNNNLIIDANEFLYLFVKVLPQNFKLLRMYTPDWWFSTNTLKQFLEKIKFRIKSMCWMNYGYCFECSEVLSNYVKLNGCKLLYGEDCEFVSDNLGPYRINVFFNESLISA
ncbi:hypothetical protein C1645_828109 [Glomus cerebriforme]|uniref:F-box domain-containing protein n=1 Tax=Glomus cerebriforme TaxID=658196 RepID=A0A397SRI6_9GLOM|nr:hypothetical protein C1645_828109 [Glomus cerebriforme]